jgi:hypothetical protein
VGPLEYDRSAAANCSILLPALVALGAIAALAAHSTLVVERHASEPTAVAQRD